MSRASFRARIVGLGLGALGLLGTGCSSARMFVASSADYEDYRAVRMAAHPGTRLARARTYLERHPKGLYAQEIAAIYAEEEPEYFERAKASPEGARDYLASLPGGPHAEAASSLLREDYERKEEIALALELRDGRAAEARYQRTLAKRKAAVAALVDALAAMVDPSLLSSRREAPPASLVRAVHGELGSLSGMPERSERDLFFTLPGRVERPDRVLTLSFALEEKGGRIASLTVSGDALFVHFTEADLSEALDPTEPEQRKKARLHAREVIAGAIEARFPEARCARKAEAPVWLSRACDGASFEVREGTKPGEPDVLTVKKLD